MAVLADAGEEEVDAAVLADEGFVAGAFGWEGGGVAVEDVGVAGVDVDVGEEVGPHESVVAFGVVAGEADVFVLEGEKVRTENKRKGETGNLLEKTPTMLNVTTFLKETWVSC